jgi:hypothetical protein
MLHKDAPHAPHDAPDADRQKPADPAAPVIIEYPKVLYHADGRTLTVANAEQEAAAAKDGFSPTPGGTPSKDTPDAHPKRG